MKNLCLFFIAIGSLFFISSCTDSVNMATTEDAALVVGSTLASEDGGTVDFIESSVGISGNKSSQLKIASTQTTLVDSTVNVNLTSGSRSWTMTGTYSLQANWEGSLPVSLVTSHTYSGNFESSWVSSTHTGSGTSTYTELGSWDSNLSKFVSNSSWKMNGTYDRSGTTTKKASGKVLNHTTHIVLTDVMINHVSKKIVSGTATIVTSGNVPAKGDFSYTGTLTFNGNGIATLVVGGKSYTITLLTGEVTAN